MHIILWALSLSLSYDFWNSCKRSGDLIPTSCIPKTHSDLLKDIECQLFADDGPWHAVPFAGDSLYLVNLADRTMVGCSTVPEIPVFPECHRYPIQHGQVYSMDVRPQRVSVCARCWKAFARLMYRISAGFPRIICGIWSAQKSVPFWPRLDWRDISTFDKFVKDCKIYSLKKTQKLVWILLHKSCSCSYYFPDFVTNISRCAKYFLSI